MSAILAGINYNKVLLTETVTYKLWESAGRKIVEAQLTADQISQIFQTVQQDMTAAGGNRTMIGKGVDAASAVNKAWEDLKSKVYNSGPMSNFAAAYDKQAEKLKQATGGDQGVFKYIKMYRDFAEKHPIIQGFVYSALIAAAGISGAGLGGAAVLGLFKLTDQLLQGKDIRSAIYQGAKTGALAYGASKLGDLIKGKSAGQNELVGKSPEEIDDIIKNTPGQTGDVAASLPYSGPRSIAKEAERIFREKVANGEVTDYNSYQDGMQDAINQAVKKFGDADISAQSQMISKKMLQGQLDTIVADANNGNWSGSGPQKVKELIKALGGQPDAGSLDQQHSYFSNLDKPIDPATLNAPGLDVGVTSAKSGAELGNQAASGSGSVIARGGEAISNSPMTWQQAMDKAAQSGATGVRQQQLARSFMKGATARAAGANESKNNNVRLTESQVKLIFRYIERQYNLNEGLWDTIKDKAGKAVSGVVDYAKTKGQNLTTKVTADKLMQAWKKAGSPTDSTQISALLVQNGVTQDTVNSVFAKMKIPAGKSAVPQGGGKVAGQLSQTPNAIRKREQRAAAKAAAAPTAPATRTPAAAAPAAAPTAPATRTPAAAPTAPATKATAKPAAPAAAPTAPATRTPAAPTSAIGQGVAQAAPNFNKAMPSYNVSNVTSGNKPAPSYKSGNIKINASQPKMYKEEVAEDNRTDELSLAFQQAKNITKKIRFDNTVNEILTGIELLVEKYNIDKDSFQVAETEVKNAQRQLEAAIYGLDEIFLNAAKVQEDNLSEEGEIEESYSANDIADELLDRHGDLIRRFGHEVVAQTILNVAKEYPAKSINELIEIIIDKLQTKNEGQIYSTGGGAGQSYRKYKAKPAGVSENIVNINDPKSDGWRVYKVKSAGL